MRIGVDLHGFMDSYVPILKPILIFMKERLGVKIYVLSGPEKHQIFHELNDLGYIWKVHYDEIFSIVDFLKDSKDPDLHRDKNGHWWTTDLKWFSSKAKFCKKEKIEVVFDDKIEYQSFMEDMVFYRIEKEKK